MRRDHEDTLTGAFVDLEAFEVVDAEKLGHYGFCVTARLFLVKVVLGNAHRILAGE